MDLDNVFKVIMAIIFTANSLGNVDSVAPDYEKAVDAFKY